MKIEELGLSARAYNCLRRARIETVEQLQQLSDDDLLRIRNMGARTVEEIRKKVVYIKKPATIADMIRKSDNEKMANALAKLACPVNKICKPPFNCCECWLEVIQEPAEEA